MKRSRSRRKRRKRKIFLFLFFFFVAVERSHGLGHSSILVVGLDEISVNERCARGKHHIENIATYCIGHCATAKRPKKTNKYN